MRTRTVLLWTAMARRLRDRELEKIGLRRTIETLRTWDEYVRNACR